MSTIRYEIRQNSAWITLNRPEVYNSFNGEMIRSLQVHLQMAAADPSVRVVVIKGEGKAFCAGQDLAEVLEAEKSGSKPDFQAVVDEHYTPLVLAIRQMNKPVVAAVNGVAAGAGANLALACDLVIATASARFIQAFSKIGLVPDTGGTYLLPRLVGTQRAMGLMLLGEPVQAPEAVNMGMIYAYFPDEEFTQELERVVNQLAQMPTRALGYTKHLIYQSAQQSLEEQLKSEGEYQAKAGNTKDYAEGVAAFLEKRKPQFTGE